MPTVADYLTQARESYAAKLAALAALPNYKVTYSIGGRSVSWTEYQSFLLAKIAELDALIGGEDPPADLVTAIE